MKKRKWKWNWRRTLVDRCGSIWQAEHGRLTLEVRHGGSGGAWHARVVFWSGSCGSLEKKDHVPRKTWRAARESAQRMGVQLLRDVFVAARDAIELELDLELPE